MHGTADQSAAALGQPAPVPSNERDRPSSPDRYLDASGSSSRRLNTSIWRLRYNGSNVDLENYLAQLDCVALGQQWTDGEKGVVLLASLEGNAARVMTNIPKGCTSYSVVSAKLRQMFTPEAYIIAYKARFQSRMRNDGESAHAYSLALRELAHKAYPTMEHQSLESLLVDQFIRGQPQHMRVALATSSSTELESLVATAIRLEAYSRSPSNPEPFTGTTRRTPTKVKVRSGAYEPPDLNCWPWEITSEAEAVESDSPVEFVSDGQEDDPTALVAEAVLELLGEDAMASCLAAQRRTSPGRICFFCRGSGHFYLGCPKFLAHIRENGYRGTTLPRPAVASRPPTPRQSNSPRPDRPGLPVTSQNRPVTSANPPPRQGNGPRAERPR